MAWVQFEAPLELQYGMCIMAQVPGVARPRVLHECHGGGTNLNVLRLAKWRFLMAILYKNYVTPMAAESAGMDPAPAYRH
jgi:hypothetical protein